MTCWRDIILFLSGFLIANRYFDEKVIWKSYFINRFARIYPSFFILTTLTFLYTSYKTNVFNAEIYLSNITFIKGFFNNLKFTGIAQSWSLTVEEFFYLLAPFFLLRKEIFLFISYLLLVFY
ncbi:acyltransferase family protein [Flavobacterium oreochromis]|uniref:acyltransferase family protein n=1 Tax=Flavobacterium oreochromis TaxID=2906078 RepID=UPI0035AD7DDB